MYKLGINLVLSDIKKQLVMYSLEVTKMARKFVQYNGDTTPYPWCATSEYLVKDQVYEVVQEID